MITSPFLQCGFYFFLIIFTYAGEACVHRSIYFKPFFLAGTLFLIASLTIAIIRPYQKARMNILDSILLSTIAVVFYNLCADITGLLILNVLLLAPIAILTLVLLQSKLCKASVTCFLFQEVKNKPKRNSSADSQQKQQPLIPSSTVIQYGAC